MSKKSYNNFFSNFANRTRFGIIMALRKGGMNVTEIAEALGEEQSKVSHNLKTLTGCHILSVKQEGKHRIYSLNKDTVLPMLELVEKHVRAHCLGQCPREEIKKC